MCVAVVTRVWDKEEVGLPDPWKLEYVYRFDEVMNRCKEGN